MEMLEWLEDEFEEDCGREGYRALESRFREANPAKKDLWEFEGEE